MSKVDILSPAFFSGLIGYAVTGTGAGFWIGSIGVWLALFGLIAIAVAVSRAPDKDPSGKSSQMMEPAE